MAAMIRTLVPPSMEDLAQMDEDDMLTLAVSWGRGQGVWSGVDIFFKNVFSSLPAGFDGGE